MTGTILDAGKSIENEEDKNEIFMALKLNPTERFSYWCNKLQISLDGKNLDGLIKFLKDWSVNNTVNY